MDVWTDFFWLLWEFSEGLHTFLQKVSHKDLSFKMKENQHQPPEEHGLVKSN